MQSLKTKLYQYFLNKEAAKVRTLRLSTNLQDASSVGLLFVASDEKQKSVVLRYADKLRKQGKKVELLGFFDTKQEIEQNKFLFFTQRNINWFNKPKGKFIDRFIKQPFDLLINLSGKTTPPFDFITTLSKASFRVGPSTTNTDCCDLMIDTRKPEDVSNFITQAEFFLNKMATHHEPTPA